MILISNSKIDGKKIALKLKSRFLYTDIKKYPDGEKKLSIRGKPAIADVVYFRFDKRISFDEQLLDLVCLLNKFAAKNKTSLILPYLPYLRSYPLKKNEVDKLSFIVGQLNKCAKNIFLLYPHNIGEIKRQLIFKNVILIDADYIIIDYLKSFGKDIVLVSPDLGFSENVKRFAEKGGFDYVIFNKRRVSPKKIILRPGDDENRRKISQNKNKLFIVADDIISTGKTLSEAGLILRRMGVKRIKYFAVHNTNKSPLKIKVVSLDSLDGNNKCLSISDGITRLFK